MDRLTTPEILGLLTGMLVRIGGTGSIIGFVVFAFLHWGLGLTMDGAVFISILLGLIFGLLFYGAG